MKIGMIATIAIVSLVCLSGMQSDIQAAPSNAGKEPLDLTRVEPASGELYAKPDRPVGIAGKIFECHLRCGSEGGWATWQVANGYSVFEVFCGVDDESGNKEKVRTFSVSLDGDVVKTVKLSLGDKAVKLSLPVKSGDSLRLAITGGYGVFAEPRLLSKPSSLVKEESTTALLSDAPTLSQAMFVVDPNDLDKLADALRKRVDAKPILKERIEKGNVALMTFTLVDIASTSVAVNVAENLATALINNDFPLVERGQLDKVLKELKIQDSALVDPITAQKIGKMSGCDIILLGSISDQGQFVVINARLMDTASGKSLAAERVEMRKIPISR